MFIRSLDIHNYKNLARARLDLDPSCTLLVGPNGAGKSNLLETILLLERGRGFRNQTHEQCTGPVDPSGWRVEAALDAAGRSYDVATLWRNGSRQTTLLAENVSQSRLASLLAVVSFEPADKDLVFGGAEERRKLLDRVAFYDSPEHLERVRNYKRVLQQRNFALRQHYPRAHVEPWTQQVALLGAEVWFARGHARKLLTEALHPHLRAAGLDEISTLEYRTAWNGDSNRSVSADSVSGPATEDLRLWLEAKLHASFPRDLQAGRTSVGPHGDDLEWRLDGKPASVAASHGQARTFALSCRLAQTDIILDRRNEPPVVLLDDIEGELDDIRLRTVIGRFRERGCQILLTSADGRRAGAAIDGGATFQVDAGAVTLRPPRSNVFPLQAAG